MQIINEQEAQEDRLRELNRLEREYHLEREADTKEDLKVIMKSGLGAVNNTNPITWLIITAIVIVVIAVLPITIIALAFGAGHYSNWLLGDNNKNKR